MPDYGVQRELKIAGNVLGHTLVPFYSTPRAQKFFRDESKEFSPAPSNAYHVSAYDLEWAQTLVLALTWDFLKVAGYVYGYKHLFP